jgi:hypothetical protein
MRDNNLKLHTNSDMRITDPVGLRIVFQYYVLASVSPHYFSKPH